MKLSLGLFFSALTTVVAAAVKERKLDENFLAQAFGAVQDEHDPSEWKNFLSDGPLDEYQPDDSDTVDIVEDHEEQNNDNNRELWYSPRHYSGWYSIDTDGDSSLEVKNRGNDECFGVGEGIDKDGWKFGITTGIVPGTNSTATDTYLMLFEEWSPYVPIYKAFQGATKLCIGEKKGNVAYLYVYFGKGCYYLVGYPDAGRDDHKPKLKIREQDRRRERNLRNKVAADERELWSSSSSSSSHRSGGSKHRNRADKLNDKFDKYHDVIVRFRDGPGIVNSLWQIFASGFSKTSPAAQWYFVPY